MDNLRKAIEILFLKQEPGNVLKQHFALNYPKEIINKEWFKQTFLAEHGPYSGNQADQLYGLVAENWVKGNTKNDSVFNLLLEFDRQVLCIKDNNPVCKYKHYLRWHELTALVGEDVLTCSFLANEERNAFNERKSFAWKLVLESDNTQLECLFQRGLTELHCHLNGSSLNFDTNWLAIMNEPLYQKGALFKDRKDSQLYEYAILAAYIRMYLYMSVNGVSANEEFFKKFQKIWSSNDRLFLIHFYLNDLQAEIATHAMLRGHWFDGKIIDYAIPVSISKRDEKSSVCQFIVGERRLMYQCFQNIYNGNDSVADLPCMFYLYLIIKIKVKSLIVQHNSIKGFENFKYFDINKEKFIENARNKAYQELIPKAAIYSYQANNHIEYFEFRIAPKSTPVLMRNKLNKLEYWFDSNRPHCVFHFIKKSDSKYCYKNVFLNALLCRNNEGRNHYKRLAGAIEILLCKNEQRIVGIDAANSEFGCRPEVFAEIYRRLQHLQKDSSMEMLIDYHHKDLGLTYHVGEDYYDIVDGLRAIEEAVLFLNLADGARLGHAVALGIDASKYYSERKNTIIIPKQDLLDNCVWLLAKMDEYGIQDNFGLRNCLIFTFQRLTNELYPESGIENYRIYYLSWLLRGDNPYLYQDGEKPKEGLINYSKYTLNHFDKHIDLAREDVRACELYRAYHFDSSSKFKGYQPEEFCLSDGLIVVIEEIQEKMREDIARRKIAIEVNPTSNLRICNIDTYDSHPILKFRNYGLPVIDENDNCPQISVSINTDDQGIFTTSLEKEYTLMALAVEKMKDGNGNVKYKPHDILTWLEDIRKQCVLQRFVK